MSQMQWHSAAMDLALVLATIHNQLKSIISSVMETRKISLSVERLLVVVYVNTALMQVSFAVEYKTI